jgi:glycosyltransferase involved in cell wall biosynthesis
MLVGSGGTDALAEAVARILMNDALRTRLSEKALAYSRSFSWDKVANEFIKVVETIL